jgi:hypothetical protein
MNLRVSSLLVLSIACSLSTFGCGPDTAVPPNPITVIPVALDRGYSANQGLVMNLDEHGYPYESGPLMDPIIKEGRRFYDTLNSPTAEAVPLPYPNPFTDDPDGTPYTAKTAPLTLNAWKQTFNIPVQAPDEPLAAYRDRIQSIVYYNKNELGLGRELGCAEFDDGLANGPKGVACFVTNYGTAFRDANNSLRLAVEGLHAKNTVCITYRPSLPSGYQVQFYTFNGSGNRIEWAQLDYLGPRPQPNVCMNCHGGIYDSEKHLARYAHFLPMDPNVVVYGSDADAVANHVTRADLEERIRNANYLGYKSGEALSPAQRDMLDKLYGGNIAVPGATTTNEWYPSGWNDTQSHRELFDRVVKPNCETCHLAMQTGRDGNTRAIYNSIMSPASFMEANLPGVVCGSFAMPNSQATRLNFWEVKPEPIVHNGASYDSPAEVLLGELGLDRSSCQRFEAVSNCNRGTDPDALCGNSFSGQACNRVTGQCVPELGPYAPTDRSQPNGICKMDRTRNCPWPLQCQPRAANDPPPEGLEGYDGVCLPDAQYPH